MNIICAVAILILASFGHPAGLLTASSSTTQNGQVLVEFARAVPTPVPTPTPTPIPPPAPKPPPLPTIIPVAKLSDISVMASGASVVVKGAAAKWEPSMKAPPATRSDWVLADSSGFVWITGMMSPKIGTQVVIVGVVVLDKGRQFIRVSK